MYAYASFYRLMHLIWLQRCKECGEYSRRRRRRYSIEDALWSMFCKLILMYFQEIAHDSLYECTNMGLFTQVVINCTDRIRIGSHCLTRYSDNVFNTQTQTHMNGEYVLCTLRTSYYNPINANWKHHIYIGTKNIYTQLGWKLYVMCMGNQKSCIIHKYVIKSPHLFGRVA